MALWNPSIWMTLTVALLATSGIVFLVLGISGARMATGVERIRPVRWLRFAYALIFSLASFSLAISFVTLGQAHDIATRLVAILMLLLVPVILGMDRAERRTRT